jgi:hypothetical protein
MKLRMKIAALLIGIFSLTAIADQALAQVRVTIGNNYQRRPMYRNHYYSRPYYGYRHDYGLHRGWYKDRYYNNRNNGNWDNRNLDDRYRSHEHDRDHDRFDR